MINYVLRTNKLSKHYNGQHVLNGVNMNVKKGDIYGFIGRNGSGKTTLFRAIAGLINISEGSIELFGKDDPTLIMNERKRIGTLIEKPGFNSNMTAGENMELIRLQRGIPGKEPIEEKLKLVGLNDVENKKVKNFSLGMKQRLGIAIALLGDPEFLILDEPINGLDPMAIVQMRELFKKLNKEKGTTILISSHVLSELDQIASVFGIINNGELIEEISHKELEEKSKKAIEIKVTNTEKSTWVLENVLNTNNYKVLPEGTIKLYDYIDKPEEVSKALTEEGIMIKQIVVVGDDLEEYYMNLVGGGRYA